jgi:membrane fusion protein, multidrug efflux system
VQKVKLGAAALVLLGAAGGIYAYEVYSEHYPSTDDAYVIASVVHVAPQVSGQVSDVYIADHQQVSKGDALYRIAEGPFRYAVEAAQARLDKSRQTVAGDEAAVVSARAEVERQQVLLANAKAKARRNRNLQANNFVTKQNVDDAEADYRAAQAGLAVAKAKLNEAQEKLGAGGDANQAVREAQADLDEARWNLAHTRVNAACNGYIAEKHLNPGDAVIQGQPNFVLVCSDTYWVQANFKETELEHIHPGQSVDIKVDMYPDRDFHGKVESIGAASGVAFSLLPPQNASGNWVKVTQRVPVKIRVLDKDAEHPLRVGTSTIVKVDTHS